MDHAKEDPEARAEAPLDAIPQDDGGSPGAPGIKAESPEQATMDEAGRLKELHADVRNQDDLERDITRQVGTVLQEA